VFDDDRVKVKVIIDEENLNRTHEADRQCISVKKLLNPFFDHAQPLHLMPGTVK